MVGFPGFLLGFGNFSATFAVKLQGCRGWISRTLLKSDITVSIDLSPIFHPSVRKIDHHFFENSWAPKIPAACRVCKIIHKWYTDWFSDACEGRLILFPNEAVPQPYVLDVFCLTFITRLRPKSSDLKIPEICFPKICCEDFWKMLNS